MLAWSRGERRGGIIIGMKLCLLVAVSSLLVASSVRAEELPPDLGTRKQGIDWPDFLGPQRDSRSPETGLNTNWKAHPPRVVWHTSLGESYSAPSVSRGRLFHFDRHGDVHRLTCRHSETGEELWTHELPADFTDMLGYNNGPRATPVVDGNRVYVASPEGLLECVDVTSGEQVWRVDTLKEFGIVKNFFGVGSTPLVWQDLVIVNVGGSPADSPPDVYAARGHVEGNGSGVVAFDKLTGKVRWQATDELASYASPVVAPLTAEAGERPWCFVLARGGLVALDPRNGAVDFQFPWRSTKLESVNASSPVVVSDKVFISEAYGPGSALLHVGESLRDSNSPVSERPVHKVVWQDELRSRDKAMELHWNTAVHHDGYLYGSSGQHGGDAELRCIELATGEAKWSERGLARSSLLYVDGCFVCLSEDGALRLLRATPEKYEVLAEFTPTVGDSLPVDDSLRESNSPASERPDHGDPLLEYPAWAAPVLSHGLLYVRGSDRLVCLEVIPEGVPSANK
jgi:outer membrane protein assembly factor BamB